MINEEITDDDVMRNISISTGNIIAYLQYAWGKIDKDEWCKIISCDMNKIRENQKLALNHTHELQREFVKI